MTDKEKLISLIDAVLEWAARPTKDGANNLRNLADSLDPRKNFKYLSEESTTVTMGGTITRETIEEAALKAMEKGGGIK